MTGSSVPRNRLTALIAVAALAVAGLGPALAASAIEKASNPPKYALEADVSMRTIRVDFAFTGARLVLFGAIAKTGPEPPDPRNLDIVAVIEGAPAHLTVRRKSRVGLLWLNTDAVAFAGAPRYYAVASTRPLNEIASKASLADLGLGLDDVPIMAAPSPGSASSDPDKPGQEIDAFRHAAVGLGVRDHHYVRYDRAIGFVGSSLFRGEIDLPANVPVGNLDVKVYLFGGHEVLARYKTHLSLEREGIENFIYAFARQHALIYGLATVAMTAGIGLFASYLASRHMR